MHRSLPAVLLLMLLAAASLGAAAPGGTPTPTPVEGAEAPPASARTVVRLLEAVVTGADGTSTPASLGELHLASRRDGPAWAGIDLVGAETAGQRVAERSVTTDDGEGDHAGDLSLTLPATAGVAADLRLLEYLVRAEGREAASRIGALDGRLELPPLALRVDDGGRTLTTSVGEASVSTTTLALGAVELTLGDLLPPEVVDDLPLGVVVELLQQLPVSAPTVAELLELVDRLVADLAALLDAATALDRAKADLRQLVSDAPGMAEAEAAVAAAEEALADVTSSLREALADRDDARATLTEAEELLAEVLEDTAEDTTDELTDTVDDTTDTVTEPIEDATDELTDTVDDTTDTVTDPVEDATDAVTDPVDDATDTVTDPVDDATDTITDPIGGSTEPVDDVVGGLGGSLRPTAVLAAVAVDVEEAEAAVAEAEAALAAADRVVGTVRAEAGSAEEAVVEANAHLDALMEEAVGAVDGATGPRDEVVRLRGEVQMLLDRVVQVAQELPDLSVLLDQLRGGLADVPVLSLEGLWLDVALHADEERGRAEITCLLGSITVFGETLTDPRCGQAGDLLATVPARMAELLASLPLAEPPTPRITGLAVATDASPEPVDGVTWATADVTGLDVEVPSVALQAEPDGLTTQLDDLLAQAITAARSLTGTSFGASAPSGLDAVVSLLDGLRGQLDGLPRGSELEGRRTVGVDMAVGRLAAEVLHGTAAEDALQIGTPFTMVPALATTSPVPTDAGGGWDTCYTLALLSLGLAGGMWRQRRRLAELA